MASVFPSTPPHHRTPPREHHRVSPYPSRVRTPPTQSQVAVSTPRESTGRRFELVVRPIVKSTIAQRDSTGEPLAEFVVSGDSFEEMIAVLWTKLQHRMKGRAVKIDGVWELKNVTVDDWKNMLRFKYQHRVQDNSRPLSSWEPWLKTTQGKTVALLVYVYGDAIVKTEDLEDFRRAAIRPEDHSRAIASTASPVEASADAIQETRNLDLVDPDHRARQASPPHVPKLMRERELQAQQSLSNAQRSAHLAMEVIQACLADYEKLRRDFEALGRSLEICEKNLQTRQRLLTTILRDLSLPGSTDGPW